MDNARLDVVNEGEAALRLALALAMGQHAQVTHWKVSKARRVTRYWALEGKPTHGHSEELVVDPADAKARPTLILLWHDEGQATPLPAPMELEATVSFVKNWLAHATYGREPDHDGSNGRGFRVFTEDWGHVYDHHYAVVGIQPAWAMYGK
jgi:hypothetical protein